MRIDPKSFTLDVLDRVVILSGLEMKRGVMRAKVARLKESTRPESLASLERAENTLARIEDLISQLEG